MEPAFITCSDGCQIHYRFDGPEDAPVLMLSNSLGTAMAMWEPQLTDFVKHFRVLRYDQRGHGLSASPRGAYSIDRLGSDVIELLDALKLDKVHFCGLSLGGMTGQWLGIRSPDRLKKLILANTSPYMGPPSAWDARIELVYREGLAALAQTSAERWFTAGFIKTAPQTVVLFQAQLAGNNVAGYAGCCAAIRDMDLRPTAGLIDVPTLVIAGVHDPATPSEHAEFLATNIQAARLAHLNAAHLSNIEQPESFAELVLEFLEEL